MRAAQPRALGWIVAPLLRALEYGFLVTLTALVDRGALPICFALLCVLAFHHYDVAYRLRHQRTAPPRWILALGGGWDGRIVAASGLALAGVLRWGLLVAAATLGLAYAAESTSSWLRFGRTQRPVLTAEEELD